MDSIIVVGAVYLSLGLFIIIGVVLNLLAKDRMRSAGRARVELIKLGIIGDRREGRTLARVLKVAAYSNAGAIISITFWFATNLVWRIFLFGLWSSP